VTEDTTVADCNVCGYPTAQHTTINECDGKTDVFAHLDQHYADVEAGRSDAECCCACCPDHWNDS
jgi:hypothetical protein